MTEAEIVAAQEVAEKAALRRYRFILSAVFATVAIPVLTVLVVLIHGGVL